MTNVLETVLVLVLAAENSPDSAISSANARGSYQITSIVVYDVNLVYKTKYTHEAMHVRKTAREVAEKFIRLLQKRYPEHAEDVCWLVRAYGCGPKATERHDGYWYYERGKKLLEKLLQ